ncbi:AraC family transcriptional regulator [Clostridium sp. 19966]|uniref:AraC family transcriptional regulator n=1 Tax=Clostridium sp. 19966 TaxID=2768166 RepID=UPI0028DDF108|nr:AraC family transcriptional regulator [Clostridium sp. 19966]MDT8718377.1 AraC family transcriptional regulator [Clostridium sp. 19966]
MQKDIILINKGLKDINPLLCGYEKCEKNHGFGPASREYYLIHYILSGKGKFTIREKSYKLSSGDMFIIRPQEITYYEADSKDPWEYIWIGFDYDSNAEVFSGLDFLKNDVITSKTCENIFRSMLLAEKLNFSKEMFLSSKLFELFSILVEGSERSSKQCDLPNTYVMKAKNYIDTQYVNKISVEAISNFLGIDRRYFCSIFKKYLGKSPQKYIIDLRLEKAARLLLEQGYSPSEAAASTGYEDIFNFSKMFKKKYGAAPLHYKKQGISKEEMHKEAGYSK